MPVIASRFPLSRWLKAGGDAWDWWFQELWATLPATLKAWVSAKARADIFLRDDSVEILCSDRDAQIMFREDNPLGELDSTGWDELAGLLMDRSARLFLQERDIFCAELQVPRASGRDLPSAIAYQLEMMSPIQPALATWSWAAISAEREKATVLVALARTSRLDRLDSQFGLHGLRCPPIYCETAAGRMRLRRGQSRLESTSRRWQRRAVLWSTLLFVSLPLLVLAGASLLTAIEQAKLDSLRREAGPKLDAIREARRNAGLWQAFAPLRAQPLATAMLSELGERAPDGTSIEAIDFDGGHVVRFDLAGSVDSTTVDALIHAPGKLLITQPELSTPQQGAVELSAALK